MTDTLGFMTTPTAVSMPLCTSTWLPASGIISFANSMSQGGYLTLDTDALFIAPCPTVVPTATGDAADAQNTGNFYLSLPDLDGDDDDSPQFSDFRDPFYASSFPICYALAATTVTAYMLVIMLFITPRSFFDSGVVYLGRRGGFTNSSSGGVNIGGRPWLQKLAALTVAISLTIATADTFKIASLQYLWGVQNAKVLQSEVMGSIELRVIRVISDTFLWLAQAQTLIRLFPRQREKIIIKWAAFALISLDVIFSALNSFMYDGDDAMGNSMPKSFAHPIPALSYLFQLSLGVLYAAWVIYYAIMKKRYAFYHPLMKNMCLVAVISLMSIVVPVVFFILDISKPQFTGWGDYVQWVGAAAASVVVWEWVERIEALEREEKKDGILGREVFDGDDTMEVTASELPWGRKRKSRKGGGHAGGIMGEQQRQSVSGNGWPGVPVIGNRHRDRGRHRDDAREASEEQQERRMGNILRPPVWLTRPTPVATPVSRTTDTASAASTIYAVRYQGGSEATTRTPEPPAHPQSMVDLSGQTSIPQSHPVMEDAIPRNQASTPASQNGHIVIHEPRRWIDVEANIVESSEDMFHRGGDGSPARRSSDSRSIAPQRVQTNTRRWDVRGRLEEFAVSRAEKMRERLRPITDTESLPLTVIPAPPRRGAALQQVLEEDEVNSSALSVIRRARRSSDDSSYQEEYDDTAQPEAFSTASRTQERSVSTANPPLWPGVNHRHYTYEEDDDDDGGSFDDTATEASSVAFHEQEREAEPDLGPDDRGN